MSLGRSPCDSLVLKDDKKWPISTIHQRVYAAILNRLRSVTISHTCLCPLENTHEHDAPCCFRIQHGRPSWVMGYTEVFACG